LRFSSGIKITRVKIKNTNEAQLILNPKLIVKEFKTAKIFVEITRDKTTHVIIWQVLIKTK
jgi:hypothetical protein